MQLKKAFNLILQNIAWNKLNTATIDECFFLLTFLTILFNPDVKLALDYWTTS